MIIAYLRVSTEKQNLSNQRSEIERFAIPKGISTDRWIMEIASGKKAGKERQLGHPSHGIFPIIYKPVHE